MEKMKGTRPVKLDTLCGLIPCRIIQFLSYYNCKNKYGVDNVPSSGTKIQVEITKDLNGFKKGEILEYWSLKVVPSHKIAQNDCFPYIERYQITDYFVDDKIPESLLTLQETL